MPGYSAATPLKTRCHSSWAWTSTFDLSAIDHARSAVGLRELEGVPHDPLHPLAGVEVDLGRDLVGSVLLEVAAHHHVEALGVLAEHHEVHVFRRHALQRAELLVEEPHRPVVDVEVEPEAQAEQDVGGVPVVGDAGVAHGPEEDRVEALLEQLAGSPAAGSRPS